ncbi:MAG: PucR family transcriptional regulator ligand-binding domain-containing protein [Clostridiales Family XIII bacterium]|jgi:hypothetical protein|nr:PucR family transcriptional regulator ligand-binding domain-containing protein [Clostridiales Family XIII bacterium]
MKPRLSEFYAHSKETYQIKLIAGGGGLPNQISWPHNMEDMAAISHLQGGELIITTGIAFVENPEKIEALVRRLISKHCSALLINTGKYLYEKDIPESVILLCNANNFPLFSIPWGISIMDMTKDLSNKIFEDTYLDYTLPKLLQRLIFDNEMKDSLIPLINAGGYETESNYCIILIRHLSTLLNIDMLLNEMGINHHMFSHDDLQVAVLNNIEEDGMDLFIKTYHVFIDKILARNPSIAYPTMGISEIVPHLSRLHNCYHEALYALSYADYNKLSYQQFREFGVYRILFSVTDKDLLRRYFEETLHPLIEYDQRYNSELLQTLRLFLMFNGSIQQIADKLYIHRNTVNYRMSKIRTILGKNLISADEKFQLQLSFYIRALFEFHDFE